MSSPGKNKGVNNIKAKLTEDEVKEIFLNNDLTQSKLAEKYKVTQSTINHIKRQRIWKWLTKSL